ncbi:hypothetical protein EVAR_54989_1 [Eumeta japonica]|uniref:Uncharacterized protein n=1 Tax=Eumeta variegata TaxID=151549 RepID=A0A4C1Z592_EUMVA|nr:hypothetical protein EVAR_54989_1 [Eumeta japonica]
MEIHKRSHLGKPDGRQRLAPPTARRAPAGSRAQRVFAAGVLGCAHVGLAGAIVDLALMSIGASYKDNLASSHKAVLFAFALQLRMWEQISLVGEIRLLGLTIDRKLTFIPHVAKACRRTTNIYKGISRSAKAT